MGSRSLKFVWPQRRIVSYQGRRPALSRSAPKSRGTSVAADTTPAASRRVIFFVDSAMSLPINYGPIASGPALGSIADFGGVNILDFIGLLSDPADSGFSQHRSFTCHNQRVVRLVSRIARSRINSSRASRSLPSFVEQLCAQILC